MSRTLTISDDLYTRLEAEARARGADSIEHLLEEKMLRNDEYDFMQRKNVVSKISASRARLFLKYGEMPDSVELLHEDRNR